MLPQSPELTVIKFNKEKTNDLVFTLDIRFSIENEAIKYNFGEISISENDQDKQIYLHLDPNKDLTKENWRKLGGVSAKYLKSHKINNLFINNIFIEKIGSEYFLAFIEGLLLGNFSFDYFKQENKTNPLNLTISCDGESIKKDIVNLQKLCSIINYCRELGQLPGNVINPPSLAKICLNIAGEYKFQIKILDENDLDSIGAEAILSVGKGSGSKPRLIILEYKPEKVINEKPIVLVGKAITFDTGGYSIKTVDGIKGMKSDKLGGITVLGTLIAASQLNIQKHIVGIICAAENMISHEAYRPDDIIKTLSGKTVEILSTDAEGRLVLADGLTCAQQNYQPECIIDFATLTGGIVVALGKIRAGLFSNNKQLSDQLFAAGESTYERIWPMPLDDDYFEFIKGDDADLKNSGGREGHPIMGAIFLKQFIENEIPWAHIDIAGAATSNKAEHYQPKGANGFGIRLMVHFLSQL